MPTPTPHKMTEEELRRFPTQYRLVDMTIACNKAIEELHKAIALEDPIQQSFGNQLKENAQLSIKVRKLETELSASQKLVKLRDRERQVAEDNHMLLQDIYIKQRDEAEQQNIKLRELLERATNYQGCSCAECHHLNLDEIRKEYKAL